MGPWKFTTLFLASGCLCAIGGLFLIISIGILRAGLISYGAAIFFMSLLLIILAVIWFKKIIK